MKNYLPHVLGAAFVIIIIAAWSLVAMAVKPQETEAETPVPNEQPMCGAYSHYRPLMEEERTLFEQVYQQQPTLTPKSVSTQVVAGTNYRFLCEDEAGKEYLVTIFVPLPCYQDEQPVAVTSVERL